MSNTKMVLILLGIVLAGFVGFILAKMENRPRTATQSEYSEASNKEGVEEFAEDWIYKKIRGQGYSINGILTHAIRHNGDKWSINGLAEIKVPGRNMRINWLIEVKIGDDGEYYVLTSDLTEPFFVTG